MMLLAGWRRYPEARAGVSGELVSTKSKNERHPRWVRERERFDKASVTRIEENQADLFKYVNYIHQDSLDIEKQIRYLEYVMFEIDERRNK